MVNYSLIIIDIYYYKRITNDIQKQIPVTQYSANNNCTIDSKYFRPVDRYSITVTSANAALIVK